MKFLFKPFRSRLFFLSIVSVLIGSLVVADFWQASDTAVAETIDQPIGEVEPTARRGRDDLLIVYSNDDTRVTYGEYSEVELALEGRIPDSWDVFWYTLGAPLPAGLSFDSSSGRQLLIHGVPEFLGKWCLTIAVEVERLQTSRDVCFYSDDDSNLGAPTFHSDRNLSSARANKRYDKKIRFPRGRDYRVSTVWSNLPNSLELELSNSRGYLRVKGTPRDRTSYRAYNYSSRAPPEVDVYTVDDYRSRFNRRRVRKNYRITAVYADGETRSHVNFVTVRAGEIVVASIDYHRKPFYFNIFRNELDGAAHKFIGRLIPKERGAEYLIDSNRVTPRVMSAEGVFYLTLKLEVDVDRRRDSLVTYKQFALTVLPENYQRGYYRCPAGYYYDRIARHCVQDRGSTCPAGSYYEPEFDRCRDYLDHCPRGYYFDHFLGFCVNNGFPRCPHNYRWDPIFQSCEFSPVWCPFGFRYNWFTNRCQLNYRRSCPDGWHYNRALDRCMRNRRACANGYTWNRRTKSCRPNHRQCQRGYHWSERLNRCVFHGNNPRCPANHRYQPSTGRCVRIGGSRRCQSGYRWSHRRKECVRHSRQRPRPTARPTRVPGNTPTIVPERRPRPTVRPTRTSRPRPTVRPTRTSRPRPTVRPTRTSRPRPTARPTRTSRPRPTARPTRTSRPRPTARPTRTSRPRPTARPTRTSRPRPTARPTRTSRPRPTARPTRTSRPRPTARPTRTSRPRPTARPTRTSRPRPTARPTRTSRPRPTARPTRTSRPRPTARPTRTSRPRPTARPTRTSRPRPTARPTRTSRPRPRPTRTGRSYRNEVIIPSVVTE